MKADAIVYTSNTGYTARYAKMLGEKTGLAVYRIEEAKKSLSRGCRVIYMGWLMAGNVKGYRSVAKRYNVVCVCGVGLGDTGAQTPQARKSCGLSEDFPVFTPQGGMDFPRLRGVNRFMIKMLTKMLESKKDRTKDEEIMLRMIRAGGDFVCEDNLSDVMAWWNK